MVLFINLLAKGLTREINRDGGSIRWAPAQVHEKIKQIVQNLDLFVNNEINATFLC